jgi:hypothetical protein
MNEFCHTLQNHSKFGRSGTSELKERQNICTMHVVTSWVEAEEQQVLIIREKCNVGPNLLLAVREKIKLTPQARSPNRADVESALDHQADKAKEEILYGGEHGQAEKGFVRQLSHVIIEMDEQRLSDLPNIVPLLRSKPAAHVSERIVGRDERCRLRFKSQAGGHRVCRPQVKRRRSERKVTRGRQVQEQAMIFEPICRTNPYLPV